MAPYPWYRSVKTGVWLRTLGNGDQHHPMGCKAREGLYVTLLYVITVCARGTVLFSATCYVDTKTHEPLHLMGRNFAQKCTLTTCGTILNSCVKGQDHMNSCAFFVSVDHVIYLALSEDFTCFPRHSSWIFLNYMHRVLADGVAWSLAVQPGSSGRHGKAAWTIVNHRLPELQPHSRP